MLNQKFGTPKTTQKSAELTVFQCAFFKSQNKPRKIEEKVQLQKCQLKKIIIMTLLYVDPGSASLIIQSIVAAFAGFFIFFTSISKKIIEFIKTHINLKKKK